MIMYSSEDLEIKCKSNTMKLASFVEMQPLLSKDFTFSTRLRRCLMENRYRTSVSGTRSHTISFQNGTRTHARR